MKVLKPLSPWRRLPFHSSSCLYCPGRHRGQVRQDGGGRFQPKAGLGPEASDIQVTLGGPSLSHGAKAGPGGSCGRARDTKTPMPFPGCGLVALQPSPLPLQPVQASQGEGGLRPLVLPHIQGRAGPGRASLVLTAKGAVAGWQRHGPPCAVRAGSAKPSSACLPLPAWPV